MVKYKLIKFTGDSELEGKSTAIVSYSGESVDALCDVLNMKLGGMMCKHVEYDGGLDRWIIQAVTIAKDVMITIDVKQSKIVLVSGNDNILTMFRVVEYILNSMYETSVKYKVQRASLCAIETIRKRFRGC